MPYRPEAELKRPDLKGEFLCGHCGKTFCHAASLNRHRLNFHGDDQQCLICHQQIPHNDTVRRHMQQEHEIPRVFTCGCCNWTFPDKKELHSHNNSMLKNGEPGEARAIAISSRPPGSLSQHELRGEERTPRTKKRLSKTPQTSTSTDTDHLMAMLGTLLNAQQGSAAQEPTPLPTMTPQPAVIPTSWLNHLIAANPALLPLISMATSSSAASASSVSSSELERTPEPSPLETVLSAMMNNNEGENAPEPSTSSASDEVVSGAEEENIDVVEDEKDQLVKVVGANFLSVATEQPVSGSLGSSIESGIGSNTPSPASTSSQSIITDFVEKVKRPNKRKSIDDICFRLVAKRSYL